MKNKKVLYSTLCLLLVIWGTIFLIRHPESSKTKNHTNNNEEKAHKEHKTVKILPQKKIVKRTISSIKKNSNNNPTEQSDKETRKVIGGGNFQLINKVNPKWKSLAQKNIKNVWFGQNEIQIKEISKAIIIKHGIGRNVEHVKVSLINNKGLPASFDAYIDSENGTIINSWNKTRYELRTPLKINSKATAFVGNTVKKQ